MRLPGTLRFPGTLVGASCCLVVLAGCSAPSAFPTPAPPDVGTTGSARATSDPLAAGGYQQALPLSTGAATPVHAKHVVHHAVPWRVHRQRIHRPHHTRMPKLAHPHVPKPHTSPKPSPTPTH